MISEKPVKPEETIDFPDGTLTSGHYGTIGVTCSVSNCRAKSCVYIKIPDTWGNVGADLCPQHFAETLEELNKWKERHMDLFSKGDG